MSKMQKMQLNEYQTEAVRDDSNACLVNANVGSGKTTVLIEKIRYLHEEKQIPFSQMCVLTFTNKAAGEIMERLEAQFTDAEQKEMLLFGTFHGVALRMLQEYLPVEELGYRDGFQVMTPEEELEIALQLITEHGLKIKYKNRIKKRLDQEGRESAGRTRYQDDWEQLMDVLKSEKEKQNKMTYRDLLQNASQLLQRHPEQIPLRWVIIDELQDCDPLQMAFLEQLKKPETQLFAVGDPNQVIYSWRGSVFQIFPLLRMKYHARELSLPINYRSTGTILEAARRFLQNGAQLQGCREEGQKIVITKHYDSFQEADYLVGKIKGLHEQGMPYKEIGIFYRLQSQSEILEKTLKRNEIPCQVTVKKSMQDIPVLHWFFYVLKAISYPEDENSMMQVLCDKQYGEGWTQKKAAKELEKARKVQDSPDGIQDTSFLKRLFYLRKWMNRETDAAENDVDVWMEELLKLLRLETQILPSSASWQEDMAYITQMTEEIRNTVRHQQTSSRSRSEALQEVLNQIALSGMRFEESEEDQKDCVRLMTLHASKGLEFDCVFLIGVNYGLIPLLSGGMEAEEEERRLFFVGMTRAREYLELSYYTSTDSPRIMPGPSRFLRFLPERLVEAPEELRDQKRDRVSAQAHLQEIKKEVEQARHTKEKTEDLETVPKVQTEKPVQKNKRVRHARYGDGEIVEENEMQIVVEFSDYGRKEFIRQFAALEYLDGR